MIAVSIIFLLIEAAIIGFLVYQIWKNRNFSVKTTLAYPCLFILGFITILVIKLTYINTDPWYQEIIDSLSGSIKLLVFELDDTLFAAIKDAKNYFLLADYVGLVICSVLITSGVTIMFFKGIIFNFFRLFRNREDITYIFGLTDEAKIYLKNQNPDKDEHKDEKELLQKCADLRKKTVVILKYDPENTYDEEKVFLDEQKVRYNIYHYDKEKEFNKMMKFLLRKADYKKINVISFIDDDKDMYDFVTFSKNFLLSSDKKETYKENVQFIINGDNKQKSFLTKYVKDPTDPKGETMKDESEGMIRFFNKYDAIAYMFLWDHNFASYMPKEWRNDDCTIQDDVNVNLFVLGLGKVNKALLNDVLVNTQFVKKVKTDEGQYVLKGERMNVVIYDENKKCASNDLSFGILKYRKEDYVDKEEYYSLPEDYASHIQFNMEKDVYQPGVMSSIYKSIYDKVHEKKEGKNKVISYFLISVGSDFENAFLARQLSDYLHDLDENSKSIFFVRIKDDEMELTSQDDIVRFGDDLVLTYDSVVAEQMYHEAKYESYIYQKNLEDLTEEKLAEVWPNLSRIKQQSNLFAVASIPFKLSSLGFDNFHITETEFNDRYTHNTDNNNIDYYKQNAAGRESWSPCDVIAFMEHERWNALELSLGVLPYKRSLVQSTHKTRTDNEMFHANLCTYQGLIDFYIDGQDDVIKYDFDLMDNFINHCSNNRLEIFGITVTK